LLVFDVIKVHISIPLKSFLSPLQTNISRAGCGTEALCAAQPAGCDPASGSCFFLNAKQLSGNNFEFGLAGESAGYVAATLSTDATLVRENIPWRLNQRDSHEFV